MDPARHDIAAFPDTGHEVGGAILQRNALLGGRKPLHRFMRGQPKTIGIILVILGSAFFIQSIPLRDVPAYTMGGTVHPGCWLGPLFMACGIVYILTEYNPTKRSMTASLALSIVSLLAGSGVALIRGLINLKDLNLYGEEQVPVFEHQVLVLNLLFEVYLLTVVVILITMSVLAGVSLRSPQTKTEVVMMQSQLSDEGEREHTHFNVN